MAGQTDRGQKTLSVSLFGNARFKHGLRSALLRMGPATESDLRPALRDLTGHGLEDCCWLPDARLRS